MKSMSAIVVSVLVAVMLTGCATKKFVRTEVGNVNSKVDTLGKSLEATQEQTTQRIAAVDTKAEAAGRSATAAKSAAGSCWRISRSCKRRSAPSRSSSTPMRKARGTSPARGSP